MGSATSRPATMGRDGWELLPPIPEISILIRDCVEAKDRFLAEATRCATEMLGSPNSNTPPYRRPEQLAKAAVRGLFRLDHRGRRLALAAARRLVKEYGASDATYYAAPPYAYIHLPEDGQAVSDFHRDDYEREPSSFFISWIPLTDCTHGPIALVPGTQSSNPIQRIRWSLHTHGLTFHPVAPRLHTPTPLLGESLAWSALTYHAGTLNRSGVVQVALNTKIRNQLIPLEPSLDLSSGDELPTGQDRTATDHTRSFLKLIETLDREVQRTRSALQTPALMSIITAILDEQDHDPAERARISFSLTMAGMLAADNDPTTATIWHLAATLLAPEYLWSLQQVLAQTATNHPDDLSNLVEEILGRHPYRQVAIVVNQSTYVKFPTPPPSGLPILTWT